MQQTRLARGSADKPSDNTNDLRPGSGRGLRIGIRVQSEN